MRTALLIGLAIVGLTLIQVPSADAQPPWRNRDDRGGDDERRRGRGRDGQRSRDDRGRDDDRGERDGDRGRGRWGGGRGWGNPEDFWKRFDRNGDGMIAPDEVDERFRERLGIDKPTKIEDLVSRFRRGRGERDGQRDRDRGDRDRAPEKPLVPGFGVEADENATVPGFGPPEEPESSQTESSTSSERNTPSSNSNSGNGGSGAVSSNQYVDGVFRDRDTNGNGKLEGEELTGVRGLPPNADKNGDGKLTKEELLEATGSRSSNSSDAASSDSAKRSYRFASAQERLPSSAKSWIVSRDKNGDGQVAMHEFSRTWSDSKVREFQRYDLNGDGVVTAEEYLAR